MNTKINNERKIKTMVIILAVVMFISAAAILLTPVHAEERCAVSYINVTLKPGDNLWTIACENIGDYPYSVSDYVKVIARHNKIVSPSNVDVWTKIEVPVYTAN